MVEPSVGWLILVGVLAALPFTALAWARRRAPEPLPRAFGRWSFAYASLFAGLLLLLRFLGVPGLMALLGLFTGFMGTQRGLGPLYRFTFGPAALEAYPQVVARDAARVHLGMLIAAVACITVGLVFATAPALR